jgi:FkbM family methyltransferase
MSSSKNAGEIRLATRLLNRRSRSHPRANRQALVRDARLEAAPLAGVENPHADIVRGLGRGSAASMSNAKHILKVYAASLVAKLAPWAFFYVAKREGRASLSVEARSGWIDIVDKKALRKIRIGRKNAAYLPDLANFFDYYYGSATPIKISSKGRIYNVVDFSTPRFQEISGFPEFPILCPSLTEPYITTQQYLDFAVLKEGDVVIDLGCYSGLTSIAFSKAVGVTGKVVALEPDPLNLSAAKCNIARHSLLSKIDNIVLLNNAAGAGRGVISFTSEGAMGSADTSVIGSYRGTSFEAICLGLQDIVDSCHLEKVDFIKMDIEGAESSVLGGAQGFFERYRPRLIVEPHIIDNVHSKTAVVSILRGYGYHCEVIEQTGVSLPLVTAVPEAH